MVTFEEVVARIGELPIGDPSAMVAYARRLEEEAAAIAQQARQVTAGVDGARYESPAATRLREQAAATEARLLAAANRLMALAGDVLAAAGRVEHAQAQWRADFDRVARDLETAARKI